MPVRSSPNGSVFPHRLQYDEELKNDASCIAHSSRPAGYTEAPVLSVSPHCKHKRLLWYASAQASPLSEETAWEVHIPCVTLYHRQQSEHTEPFCFFNFELRTTINKSLLDENDINEMIKTISNLGYKKTYYLQNFLETSSNIGNISKSSDIDKNKIDCQNLTIQYRN